MAEMVSVLVKVLQENRTMGEREIDRQEEIYCRNCHVMRRHRGENLNFRHKDKGKKKVIV